VPSAHHHHHARTHGFTLLELLIVLMLGGLMMTAITTVITSQLRLGRTQLLTQQRRSDWSRFTTFLANEVGEGRLVRTNTPLATLILDNCSPPTGYALLLSVTVQIATDNANPVPRNVHYYTTGTGTNTVLWRCGPAIEPDGRLNNTIRDFIPAQLLSGIPLSAAIDANQVSVTICNYTSPACTVNAAGASAANIGPFSVRTRSMLIP
jgi:prepilin-type N-terminal cleavage/methylation domain-containing protein